MKEIFRRKNILKLFLAIVMFVNLFAIPTYVAAASENLALGKSVTANPEMNADEGELAKITDGVIERGWDKSYLYRTSTEEEDEQIKPYVQIDLGQNYDVAAIKYFGVLSPDAGYNNVSHNMVFCLSNDVDFEEDVIIVFNTDKNNFFGLGEGDDVEEGSTPDGRLIEFETVNARYLRYYQHGAFQPANNNWPNALTACEIEVYAPGTELLTPPGNYAYQARVTGSGYNSKGTVVENWIGGYGGGNLQELTSGTPDVNHWKAPGGNDGGEDGESVYVVLELKKPQDINTIKIWNYYRDNMGDRMYLSQIIQLSMDGNNWINVYNSDTDNKAGQDPDDSGEVVCGGMLENGIITGVKAGTDTAYDESVDGAGKTINFPTTQVQYIRWWCSGKSDNPLPQMLQLQAFNRLSVTFDYNDGSGKVDTILIDRETNVDRPVDPVSEIPGMLFDKWTIDMEGGEEWDFSLPLENDLVLIANWKEVAIHVVTFDVDGGTEISPIQITDGIPLTKPEDPEKEGYIFTGWKCKDMPYDFTTPVTDSILLVAGWVLPAEPDAVTVNAGLLDIVLDSHGQITKLINTLDGTDYYTGGSDDKLRSLVSLVANYEIVTPTSLSFNENTEELTFELSSINTQAVVKLEDKGNYTTFTLSEIIKPEGINIQAILWGPLKNSITTGGQTVGTAYDDKYAIGMHMLNTKTVGGWPIEFKDYFYKPNLPTVNGFPDPRITRNIYSNTAAFLTWGSALQAYTWDYTNDTMRTIAYYSEIPQLQPAMTGPFASEDASIIGSSIALYGTRPENILNVISNIGITEGLPRPTINNGEWQKDSIATGQDFLVFNDAIWGLDIVENDAKMANAAGINYIYGQYGASGPWQGDGSYKFNAHFGGSDENAKALVNKAAEYGVYVGTHTLSNLIDFGTEYTTPIATPALSYAGFSELTRDITADATTIYVKDGFPFSDIVVSGSGGNRNIRIEGELISYATCTKVNETEWVLNNCIRGQVGTTATEHNANENVYKLWNYYTAGVLGGWDSVEPMTGRMGTVYTEIGMHCMSYDSLESTKMSVYSSLLPARFLKSVYQHIKDAGMADGFITEASDMDTNIWDVHSRISWGESQTPINQMMNYLSYYRQNFFPAMLGWMYDGGNHGGYGKANLLMNLSMKGGWNAGAGWYVNRNTFNSYPHMAEMLKTWNNAIQKGAFIIGGEYTEEIQDAMRGAWSNGRVWTLTEILSDQEWKLQEVQKSNPDNPIGEPISLFASNKINTDSINGDIATSTSLNYSMAKAGEEITVYIQPHTDYHMVPNSLQILGEDQTSYDYSLDENLGGVYTFTMPTQDITIKAEFQDYFDDDDENKPLITLSGDSSVEAGVNFTMTFGIIMPDEAINKIYAQDLKILYNSDAFEFIELNNIKDGLNAQVINEDDGVIRILITSLGSENGIDIDTDLFDLIFAAKDIPSMKGNISVLKATVADENGNETKAEIPIPSEIFIISADVNGDGKISIGDLGIIGRFYGVDTADNPEAIVADVNCDGVVGLEDIIFVAKKILMKKQDN